MIEQRPATLEQDIARLLATAAESYGAGRMSAVMLCDLMRATVGALASPDLSRVDVEATQDMAARLAPNVKSMPAQTATGSK